jgi:hypothetical protein
VVVSLRPGEPESWFDMLHDMKIFNAESRSSQRKSRDYLGKLWTTLLIPSVSCIV